MARVCFVSEGRRVYRSLPNIRGRAFEPKEPRVRDTRVPLSAVFACLAHLLRTSATHDTRSAPRCMPREYVCGQRRHTDVRYPRISAFPISPLDCDARLEKAPAFTIASETHRRCATTPLECRLRISSAVNRAFLVPGNFHSRSRVNNPRGGRLFERWVIRFIVSTFPRMDFISSLRIY